MLPFRVILIKKMIAQFCGVPSRSFRVQIKFSATSSKNILWKLEVLDLKEVAEKSSNQPDVTHNST